MYLGPVVVAQQVLDPSPQHPHLWEEKKGGGGGARHLHPSLQESFPGFRYQLPFKMFTVRSFYFNFYLYNVFPYPMYPNLMLGGKCYEIQA